VIPNTFAIKATNLSNSSAWTARQDNLLVELSGKFQFPLYMVTVTASSIILTDRRQCIEKPLKAVNADNATTADTANALSANLNAAIDGTYLKARSLKKAGAAYGALDLGGGGKYIDINAPSVGAAFIIVQGLLQCANTYAVTLYADINGSSEYAPTLYWLRSVNGQVNTSYGFISLEIEKQGSQLYILGFKVNQYNNDYGSSHSYATNCKFTPKEILEVINTKK
jgi:hypothetical protein